MSLEFPHRHNKCLIPKVYQSSRGIASHDYLKCWLKRRQYLTDFQWYGKIKISLLFFTVHCYIRPPQHYQLKKLLNSQPQIAVIVICRVKYYYFHCYFSIRPCSVVHHAHWWCVRSERFPFEQKSSWTLAPTYCLPAAIKALFRCKAQ